MASECLIAEINWTCKQVKIINFYLLHLLKGRNIFNKGVILCAKYPLITRSIIYASLEKFPRVKKEITVIDQ